MDVAAKSVAWGLRDLEKQRLHDRQVADYLNSKYCKSIPLTFVAAAFGVATKAIV
jgi:hypothetical protein